MLTENAEVLEIQKGRIRVAVRSASGCGNCAAKAGCGNGILDRWLNPTSFLWIDATEVQCQRARVGGQILIGVEEGAFVRNALSLYLVPSVCFLTGAASGYAVSGELLSIFGGITGLFLGSLLVSYLVRRSRYSANFTPRILEPNSTQSAPVGASLSEVSVKNS